VPLISRTGGPRHWHIPLLGRIQITQEQKSMKGELVLAAVAALMPIRQPWAGIVVAAQERKSAEVKFVLSATWEC